MYIVPQDEVSAITDERINDNNGNSYTMSFINASNTTNLKVHGGIMLCTTYLKFVFK